MTPPPSRRHPPGTRLPPLPAPLPADIPRGSARRRVRAPLPKPPAASALCFGRPFRVSLNFGPRLLLPWLSRPPPPPTKIAILYMGRTVTDSGPCTNLFLAGLAAPATLATVAARLNHLRHRPHDAAFVHAEAAHRLLVRRELVRVEDALGAHKARVAVLAKVLGPRAGRVRGRLRLRLKLDFLASLVVRGRREAHSLPDRIHARRVELDRADLDVKAKRAAHLRLLRRLVHLVAEALRVELVLERTLRDHGLALPEVVEADARTLQEAKVLHAEG
mmetsp:Transcript_44853/g.122705  ORF Transcript_44853/g.122705 Transcript_44853/m.122705 type:complete len:276 (-) Transcript_44853:768-1595(-)